MQFLIFLLFIPLFWFMIIRPQQQQRRVHQEVVAALSVGVRVMTVGGLIGTIVEVDDELVRLDAGDGHELTFGRTFVRSIVPATDPTTVEGDMASAPAEDPLTADDTVDRTEGLAS